MIDECVTYDSTIDLENLCDNSELYIGRVFSIRIMNLDGVFSPAYYTAMMVRHDNTVGFMVLFDDSKKFYLNQFQFIELHYVTSYTLFTDSEKEWYYRFLPYFDITIANDFISRIYTTSEYISILIMTDAGNHMEIKNGDISIRLIK